MEFAKLNKSIRINGRTDPNTYIFVKDYLFDSISQLTSVLDGQSRNGDGWLTDTGKSYSDWIQSYIIEK